MISRVLNLRLNHSWLAIPRLLQTYISQGGPKLARGDQFWLPKLVRPDRFWQQNWSGGTSFGKNFCQIWSGRTNYRGDRFWHDSTIVAMFN